MCLCAKNFLPKFNCLKCGFRRQEKQEEINLKELAPLRPVDTDGAVAAALGEYAWTSADFTNVAFPPGCYSYFDAATAFAAPMGLASSTEPFVSCTSATAVAGVNTLPIVNFTDPALMSVMYGDMKGDANSAANTITNADASTAAPPFYLPTNFTASMPFLENNTNNNNNQQNDNKASSNFNNFCHMLSFNSGAIRNMQDS